MEGHFTKLPRRSVGKWQRIADKIEADRKSDKMFSFGDSFADHLAAGCVT